MLFAGLMTLVAPLDFEVSREYYLSVEGSRGKSSLSDITTVIINVTDVNDNAPAFERGDYSTEISEDLTPGGLIMKVSTEVKKKLVLQTGLKAHLEAPEAALLTTLK